MAYYRIYELDRSGHFVSLREVDCERDDQALTVARARGHPHGFEIWEAARLVAREPPQARACA